MQETSCPRPSVPPFKDFFEGLELITKDGQLGLMSPQNHRLMITEAVLFFLEEKLCSSL
jgi:hypothetical protein